jgi:hypothetical protein
VTSEVTEARPQDPWHVTVYQEYLPGPSERAWQPREDLSTAALMVVLLALVAPVIGLLWAHVSPQLSVARVVSGSDATFKAQIGDDAWFLLLAALAGVATGWVAHTAGGRGPGVVLGLTLGGGAAAAVAARVGYLAQRGHVLAAMKAHGVNPIYYSDLEFKLRALGVAIAWPIAAVAVFTLLVAIRGDRSSLR